MLQNAQKLARLWWSSILIAAAGFGLALYWISTPAGPGLDWIWGVAAFGAAAILYNIAFFILCSIFVPGLSKFVKDDTEVEGDTVTHVVTHGQIGDKRIDDYIRAYASARAATATTIVAGVLIAAALLFFANQG